MPGTSEPKDKCAHPPCACTAANDSKYCGAFCEGQEDTPAVLCECGHPDCAH
jgi:hypothetical protein